MFRRWPPSELGAFLPLCAPLHTAALLALLPTVLQVPLTEHNRKMVAHLIGVFAACSLGKNHGMSICFVQVGSKCIWNLQWMPCVTYDGKEFAAE